MKILFIGNSFSYDANIYLYNIAKAAGYDLTTLNLYIGGCSFERHAKNVIENIADYEPQYNGKFYPEYHCTVEDGLKYADWDYVSIQQVSGKSGLYDTYYPYINTLVAKIKELCPKAKILMHETWAYEVGAQHGDFPTYDCDQRTMHNALHDAYYRVAKEVGCVDVIPSGDVIMALRALDEFNVTKGGRSLARDGFHMGFVHGRYAAAATWFEKLGMGDILENTYVPEDPEGQGECGSLVGDPKLLTIIKKVVSEVCKK